MMQGNETEKFAVIVGIVDHQTICNSYRTEAQKKGSEPGGER
jgi:hypothetical protein